MKKRITITIDSEILKRAKIRAIKDECQLSVLIEKLLLEWFDDYDEGED